MTIFAIEFLGMEFTIEAGRAKPQADAPASSRKTAEQIAADKAATSTTTGGVIGFAAPTRDLTNGHHRWEPSHWSDDGR